jgi:hypothetical protein
MLYFSDSQSGVPKFQILVILKDKILISFLLGVQFSTIFGLRVPEYLMVESHLCISTPFKYHFAAVGSSNIINDLLSLLRIKKDQKYQILLSYVFSLLSGFYLMLLVALSG